MTLIKLKQPVITSQFDRMPYFSEMVNEFVNGWMAPDFRKSGSPLVNIRESEKTFDLEVAAPGFKKEDFKLAVDENVLTISAEMKEAKEEKNDRYTRKEFSQVSFSRSFNLPEALETEKIKAVYENGILNITLPKKEEVKSTPKEIKIS